MTDQIATKALILEKDQQYANDLSEGLTSLGIEVVVAADIEQARLKIAGAGYRLVYLEFDLLNETAPQFLNNLKETEPQLEVFVFCDPLTPIRQVIQAMKVWCGDFMIKPVAVETVVDKTRVILGQRQTTGQTFEPLIEE